MCPTRRDALIVQDAKKPSTTNLMAVPAKEPTLSKRLWWRGWHFRSRTLPQHFGNLRSGWPRGLLLEALCKAGTGSHDENEYGNPPRQSIVRNTTSWQVRMPQDGNLRTARLIINDSSIQGMPQLWQCGLHMPPRIIRASSHRLPHILLGL